MTTFKVFETDGWFEYTVYTSNTAQAVFILRSNFGINVRFMVMV